MGTVSVTHQRQVPAVFAELVGGASLQFFDRVVVLAVILQRQVVDIPVMAQLQDLLVCLPLRLSSCSTLTVSSMSLLRRSSRFVRCRGKQSRSHSCSSFLLDKLLLARCVQRQVPMSITLQFIDSCERPCDHTATVVQCRASDSVHRQSRGQTSCATGLGT